MIKKVHGLRMSYCLKVLDDRKFYVLSGISFMGLKKGNTIVVPTQRRALLCAVRTHFQNKTY